ncbi:MAG TPA: hypothetical protein VNY10_11865 [Roseiarcus sp.]|nr:hypothetical protein [Roseiarcus sp.]
MGDLTVDPGYAPTWVQAWVVQGAGMGAGITSTGPSQNAAESSWSGWAPGRWTAAEPGWINGSFNPGPALGIALVALRSATGTEFDWWFDVVNLQY